MARRSQDTPQQQQLGTGSSNLFSSIAASENGNMNELLIGFAWCFRR
jgi:hypothetical protein